MSLLRLAPSIIKTIGIISTVLIIDQLFKYKIRLYGGFYTCNSGIAFNIKLPFLFYWLLFGIASLIIILIYSTTLNKVSKLLLIGLFLVLGGALSNIVDRYFFGCVIDYISLVNILPTFNIADIAIFLGCFLIFIYSLKSQE